MARRVLGGAAALCLALSLTGCGGYTDDAADGVRDGVLMVGSFGRQPGQFVKPRGIAFSPSGDILYVIDRTGRVQRIDGRTGEYLSRWELPEWTNGTPTGMTVDSRDGSVWIADTHYQQILHYTPEGELIAAFGEEGTDPGQMVFPTDIAPDPADGSLWVVEYGLRSRVMHFTAEGEFIKEWGSGEYEYEDLERPMAVVVDERSRVIVADAGNHRIQIYSTEGELLDSWGEAGEGPGQLKFPYDMAVDGDGNLYIVEYGNSRVSRFTPEGEFLGWWGGPGHDAGELFSPWGVAVDERGRVAVADTNNGRVQIVDRPARNFTQRMPGAG